MPYKQFEREKWCEARIRVKEFPHYTLDMVFYIEGDKAKDYNPMVRRPGAQKREGTYKPASFLQKETSWNEFASC